VDCNIPSIVPNGTVLASMTDPESENNEFDLTKLGIGPNGTRMPMLAKGELDLPAPATTGTSWIVIRVANGLGGGPIPVYLKVVVLESP
jgi:hypothetical protein